MPVVANIMYDTCIHISTYSYAHYVINHLHSDWFIVFWTINGTYRSALCHIEPYLEPKECSSRPGTWIRFVDLALLNSVI